MFKISLLPNQKKLKDGIQIGGQKGKLRLGIWNGKQGK